MFRQKNKTKQKKWLYIQW